ncbi:MAG: TetR/AcrR family transcriptional regulator [Anaerolineae bacterium]|nr:TetR/AcrR family transcriptional regulator [Anaerolineae bacterium]
MTVSAAVKTSDSRERVLDAAEKLFMERGYASVTMRDIANLLGVRQAALYYHAPQGKEQLFREVVDRFMQRQQQGLEDVIAAAPSHLEHQLTAVMRWLVTQSPVDMIRMLRSDASHISESYAAELLRKVDQSMMRPLITVVLAAQERGEIRPLDPHVMVGMLLAVINWIKYFDSSQAISVSTDDMIHDIIGVVLHGVVNR